jgi:ABC-type multidrug transport system ATPase subunit
LERLEAINISSSYGRKRVLQEVTIKAGEGQCIAIIGINGCGKSTLLNILAGLRTSYKGSIYFEGKKADKKLFATYVGYVPQDNNLIPELKVIDNLRLYYRDKHELDSELRGGFLHELGVDDMCNIKVHALSGGMKKRVSIGCALAGRPKILILDEPDAALDLIGKADIRRYISMYKERGGTVLIATHDEVSLNLCDKVYAIKGGKCQEIDGVLHGDELLTKLKSED